MLGFLTGWYPGARVSPPGLGPVPSRAAGAVQVPAAGGVSLLGRTPHGPDGGPPRRSGDALGAETPMGRLGAAPLALLAGVFAGPDRHRPYHYPHHAGAG